MSKTVKNGSEFIGEIASNQEDDPRVIKLSSQVYELTVSKLISHNQFLAAPISNLDIEYKRLMGSNLYMTEGNKIIVDPYKLLKKFEQDKIPPQKDLIHMLLHFLLMHPFVGRDIDQRLWNIACDVAVENLVEEILPDTTNSTKNIKSEYLKKISEKIDKSLTAEKLYKLLSEGCFEEDIADIEKSFYCDSHDLWYQRKSDQNNSTDNLNGSQENTTTAHSPSQHSSSQAGTGESHDDNQTEDKQNNKAGDTNQPSFTQEQLDQLEKSWQKSAKSMKVDLETLSKRSGQRLSGLLKELEVSTHEPVDYREFLRQFAVKNEDMRLSDEEFDYIFYTYGLELYENMPLIEPLEYRSNKEIRDFCIVIDTSSSVTGSVVQEFVNTTYDVLASENTYAKKVNIHIIQCDNAVQSDTKITSINEINQWAKNFKLKGFGGTDFRPAFRYINELYHLGEFNDLGGVIYFTDGWGIYPDRMPPYKTAFCFYDEDCRPELVPPWAIQLVLHPGQLESKSVYS